GLLSYPFVVEPLLSVRTQALIWAIGFAVFVYFLRRYIAGEATVETAVHHRVVPAWSSRILWLTLAAFPALLMVATTAQITHVVAPIPLLWMVPLGLYLLSYVLAFSGRGGGTVVLALFVVSAAGALYLLDASVHVFLLRLFVYLPLLFLASLAIHAQLYRLRPEGNALSAFYLYVSLGGALGTLVVSFGAPLMFNELWEFPLAVFAALLISSGLLLYRLSARMSVWVPRVLMVAVVFGAGQFFYAFTQEHFGYPGVERNFYGITTVIDGGERVTLLHEQTVHGTQLKTDDRLPTAYFTLHSAIGRTFGYQRVLAHPDRPLSVGVIGLGAGTMAAYCLPGDTFVYYEIDRRMERIAREDFTYLSHCPGIEVRIGDGRRLMEQEVRAGQTEAYDILMVDAFNDDNIPAHLVTVEALDTYGKLLREEDSIIIFQTSNRYIKLAPLIISLAKERGYAAVVMEGDVSMDTASLTSQYVLLSKNKAVFNQKLFLDASVELPKYMPRPWTDTYSNILPLIAVPRPFRD
ncbi:MAG: fused MFS/spermidine synthase, partial [Candidatus Pacebacteria bacterium]|nr:fused MFS/spermidine synthase [Candidatus Paceibacterota bacterium]